MSQAIKGWGPRSVHPPPFFLLLTPGTTSFPHPFSRYFTEYYYVPGPELASEDSKMKPSVPALK